MTISGSVRRAPGNGIRERLMRCTALGGALLVAANAGAAQAMPKLAGIPASVAQAPVISSPNASSTTVTLKQSRTLIDWTSFNLSQGQQVDFLFQKNNWVVLNRVESTATIDGKISGCIISCGPSGSIGGNVWIYSPSGVIFGPHSQINVGGLLATTAPLVSEQDFLNGGKLDFAFSGAPAGSTVLVKAGAQLNARGSLALIAPAVATEAGAKVQAGGTALYGAAQNFVVHFQDSDGHGFNLVDFEVPASALTDGSGSSTPLSIAGDTLAGKVVLASISRPSVLNAIISVSGTTTATTATDGGGGDIVLSASGAPATVEISGQLQAAHSVTAQAPTGGTIDISGAITAASNSGAGGTISIGGVGTSAVQLASGARLDASSAAGGQSGGSVTLTGDTVQVDGAIAATGPAGGGTILVGGGDQGRNAAVYDATNTSIGAGAVLDASATGQGPGGHVVVWSNERTSFQGAIAAKGGAAGGAGGSAEVSSAGWLGFAGTVDLRAADGTAGQLLLDPSELIIVPSGGSGSISGGANPAGSSASSTIGADVIDAALLSADVTISTHMSQTGGDGVIQFNGGANPLVFNYTGATGRTLTFSAESGFLFSTSVETIGALNLALTAGGAITVPGSAAIKVTDGTLALSSGGDLTLMGALSAPQQITLTASGAITQGGGTITTQVLTGSSGGSTTLTSANAVGTLLNFVSDDNLTFVNAGTLVAVNAVSSDQMSLTSSAGSLVIDNLIGPGQVSLSAAGDISLAGSIAFGDATLSAGGMIDEAPAGQIQALSLTATARTGISLTGSNFISTFGPLTNTAFGGIALNSVGDIQLTADVTAPNQAVSLISSGQINDGDGAGSITAGSLSAAAANGIFLTGGNNIPIVRSLTSTGGGEGGGIQFNDNSGFTITGDIAAPGTGVFLNANNGGILQAGGVITTSFLTVGASGGINLGLNNLVDDVSSLNSGSGGIVFNNNQSVQFGSVVAQSGDITLATSNGDMNINQPINAPGALNVLAAGEVFGTSLTSAGAMTVRGASLNFVESNLISGGDMSLTATSLSGTVDVGGATTGGNYTVTGPTISINGVEPDLTGPTGNVTINYTTPAATDISGDFLSVPAGSLTITSKGALVIGSINVSAGLTLTSLGPISQQGESTIVASTLTASTVGGLSLDSTNIPTVTSLTNFGFGAISFSDNLAATIGPVTNGAGAVDIETFGSDLTFTGAITASGDVQASANNLTLDGITTAGNVTLIATGALADAPGASINLGGNYTATGNTIDPSAFQPTFTGAAGDLSLIFTAVEGIADLSGHPLSAPHGSVSVEADSSDLTVDSITAAGNVTLFTGGILHAAAGAAITLGGNYSATGTAIDTPLLEPTFTGAPGIGDLSLTFNGLGTGIDLSGTPLTAPGSITITANGENLNVGPLDAGADITLFSVGNLSALQGEGFATIRVGRNYSATGDTIDPSAFVPTSQGSSGNVSLTFTSTAGADLSNHPLTNNVGSVSVAAPDGDLTVDSITASGDIILLSGGNLNPADVSTTVTMTLGGDYSATALNISSQLYQPTFTAGSTGGISLTFTAIDGLVILGGFPLTAPGSISVSVPSGGLQVDSITAGGDVTLLAGADLSIAETATPVVISVGRNYSATGLTIDPRLYQPSFTAGAVGNISLTFTSTVGLDLTGTPLTAPGSLSVSAPNEALTVDSLTAGGDVTLLSGAALNLAAGAQISVGGSYSATGATIAQQLYEPVFAPGAVGNLSLDFTGGSTDLTGSPLSAPGKISVTSAGSLTIDSITTPGQLSLAASSGGAITQAASTAITAGLLTIGSAGSITLTNAGNAVTTLGVLGGVDPESGATTSSITFSDSLSFTLTGNVTTFGQVSLTSLSGAINQTGGAITADSLTATAVNGISFGGANQLNGVGPLVNSGSGGISINNLLDLNLVDNITAAGQTVSLSSQGAINQNGGVITAGVLNATAVSGITLNQGQGNQVDALGVLTNTGFNGISFTNSGDMVLTGAITAAGQSVNLISNTGAVNQTGGVITAGSLTMLASTGIALNDANQVSSIAALITQTGPTSFTNAGSFDLAGGVGAVGQSVTLVSQTGAITQSNGAIFAGVLNVSAVNGIALTGGNQVSQLGTITNSGANGVTFVNASDLLLGGDITAAGQSVSLISAGGMVDQFTGVITAGSLNASAATGIFLTDANQIGQVGVLANGASGGVFLTSAGIDLTQSIDAFGQTLSLIAFGGAITQESGAVITASALDLDASTSITLGGANQVTNLDTVSTGSVATFNNAGSLGLSGAIQGTGISLSTTQGSIIQVAGGIQTGLLNASATDGIALDQPGASATTSLPSIDQPMVPSVSQINAISTIGAISNTGSGGVSIIDGGDPTLAGDISAPGQTVSLVSQTGSVVQSGGVITASVLNVSAATGIALNDQNVIGALGQVINTGSGGVAITTAGNLVLLSDVVGVGQSVSLTSGGSIGQSAGGVFGTDVSLFARQGLTLSQVLATDQVTLTAASLSVTQDDPRYSGVVAPAITVESITGTVDLGDNLNDPGFTGLRISGATLASMSFDTIAIYAGYFDPAARQTDLAPKAPIAIKVGDLGGDGGSLDGVPGGLTISLFAGPTSTVEVLGSVTSTSGLGNLVIGDAVADAWTPRTIAISGGLGASGTQLAPLNSVELNAVRDILLGDSKFQSAVTGYETSGRTDLININGGSPPGVSQTGGENIFIGSNTLTMRAQNVIASQNTGAAGEDVGITVVNANKEAVALTLGTTAPSGRKPSPVIIDIFGKLTDATGLTLTGKDLAPSSAILLSAPLSINDGYRVNGCVIGLTGACSVTGILPVPVKFIQGIILTTAAPPPPPTYSALPLITFTPDTSSGDPTITGVGNEEIWRGPTCDPNGGASCP